MASRPRAAGGICGGYGHGHAGLWRAQVTGPGRGGGEGDCRGGYLARMGLRATGWSGGGSAWQRERGLCGKGTNVVTVWAAGRIEF